MSTSRPSHERLVVLDLVRFLAALAVMVLHYVDHSWRVNGLEGVAFPELTSLGFTKYLDLAVAVFFIISGFVIPISVEGKTAGDFAASRFVRLFPTYWLALLLTWTVCRLWGPICLRSSWSDLMVNLTMLQNFPHWRNVDAVYWSLGVEMSFYAMVFVLVWLGGQARMHMMMTVWLGLSAIDYMGWLPAGHAVLGLEHAPFFVAGYLYYRLMRHGLVWRDVPVWGLAVVMGCLWRIMHAREAQLEMSDPASPWVIVACLAASHGLFILIATRRLTLAGWGSWVQVCGGMSYPLYVIHNYAGVSVMQVGAGHLNRWCLLVLTMTLAMLVSWAMWRWYERPATAAVKRGIATLTGKAPRSPMLRAPSTH